MSKESRRAARLARESRRAAGASGSASGASGTGASGGGANAAPNAGARRTRPVSGELGPTVGRAGRRDRVRPLPPKSFVERYRSWLISGAAILVAVLAVGWLFIGATQPVYACGSIFDPSATPTVDPSSSTRLGFQQDDMGNSHNVNPPQKYLFCPPASGNHYNNPGVLGPIQPRLYKPDDKVGPPNWVHNLEHGGMVILYRNDSTGATTAGQQAFRDYFNGFPASPICHVPAGQLSPVIARFDDMPHPFAAIVWDRVLYMDTWDPALATRFYLTESERLDADGALVAPPETQCTVTPRPTVAPSGSAAPSGSGATPSESAAPTPAPSATASPVPDAS